MGRNIELSRRQRELFSKGMMDAANIVAGGLVFGELASQEPSRAIIFLLGVTISITFYLAAYGLSKVTASGR